jgi:hypothetical protein
MSQARRQSATVFNWQAVAEVVETIVLQSAASFEASDVRLSALKADIA